MSGIKGFLSNGIGIDLGTANTLVYLKDSGVVMSEPSVVAIYSNSKKVVAVGEKAKKMLGKTPGNITAIRPMKVGVIADYEITEIMLRYFIEKASKQFSFIQPKVVIAVPVGHYGRRKTRRAGGCNPRGGAFGAPPRRAFDGGNRRGASHRRAERQHDCGHRRRHDGSRGDFAFECRVLA